MFAVLCLSAEQLSAGYRARVRHVALDCRHVIASTTYRKHDDFGSDDFMLPDQLSCQIVYAMTVFQG